MSQLEKLRNKLCIKVCVKPKKTPDYEYVSYEKTTTTTKTIRQSLNEDKKANKQISLHKPLADNPQFQSTQIEQSLNSFYTTAINENNKISSTLIQSVQPLQTEDQEPELSRIQEENEDTTAVTNLYYTSPILSRSVSSSGSSLSFTSVKFSEPTLYQSTSDIFGDAQSFEVDSNQFKSAHSSIFNSNNQSRESSIQDQLHVCVIAYQAKFEGDLSLKFAERVKLLHSVNNDYALVKNISTNQCGYVPNECLSTLSDFLGEIARNCHNL